MAYLLDLHPSIGLLAGSITLSGGHGTGAAYAKRFGELQNLHGVMELTLAMVLFATIVTFRVMGSNYDAAVMAGGHCGFGMGATSTAIANMQAVTARYGASPQAIIVIPLVVAFFIDLANALVIQGYLALPLHGF
jgi:Na+/glutamate symporter